jgi:uncharacterized protein (TIGR03032 family)
MPAQASQGSHQEQWRDPSQVVSQWEHADRIDPAALKAVVRGQWWDVLSKRRLTLLVTREYEHLVLGMSVIRERPCVSFLRVLHPSGLAVDLKQGVVHLASTRNPNQLLELVPVIRLENGSRPRRMDPVLMPVRSTFLPGSTYLHDLALIGGVLHANAVGRNVVVRSGHRGRLELAWWPKCVERRPGRPAIDRNYIQLNSIAAGPSLERSFFTASSAAISRRRPGHRNYPVDGGGVVFSGRTREPVATGLTRPHSARFGSDGRLWLDNSGYGEVGVVEGGRFCPVHRFEGWTRGLAFHDGLAFVGTSRVLPRFGHYAPGVDARRAQCGIHILEMASGRILGSITWPAGNQIFAVEVAPRSFTSGFPFHARRRLYEERALFYGFVTDRGGLR